MKYFGEVACAWCDFGPSASACASMLGDELEKRATGFFITNVRFFAEVSMPRLAPLALAKAAPDQATPEAVDSVDDAGELAPTNEIVVGARLREESLRGAATMFHGSSSAKLSWSSRYEYQERFGGRAQS